MTDSTTTAVRPLTADEARLLRDDPSGFAEETGLDVADGYLAFPEALGHIVEGLEAGAAPEWSSYLIIDEESSTVVGLGGYKGPPSDGAVEVGYSVAPAHRGRGHASNAVNEWVRRAAGLGVTRVLAHTLAEPNASTRVLERCGFERSGVIHEEGLGDVWAWQLELA